MAVVRGYSLTFAELASGVQYRGAGGVRAFVRLQREFFHLKRFTFHIHEM